MNIEAELVEHLEGFSSSPFLFVGSGLSRRYLGLETWQALLERFAALAGVQYRYLSSKANGDLPQVASQLATQFHELWWTDSQFTASRAAFEDSIVTVESPLKVEISQYIAGRSSLPDTGAGADEISYLREATIDGIITTNWDLLLERIFPAYTVYRGQEELLFSELQSVAEIYKIHGCCTLPNSLVLTTQDYEAFNSKNPYLAAKLLTVFVEHPVVFLGYSLNDPNVLSILTSVASCLSPEKLEKLTNHLIVVERSTSEESFSAAAISAAGKILPVTSIKTDNFAAIYRALGANKRRFPAPILRRLKQHVYELVRDNDPAGQMFVTDIAGETDESRVKVVYGVGILPPASTNGLTEEISLVSETTAQESGLAPMGETGYRRITLEQILRDVIRETSIYEADRIVKDTLPDLLTTSRLVPVFRYVTEAMSKGVTSSSLGAKIDRALKATTETFAVRADYSKKRQMFIDYAYRIDDLERHYDVVHCALFIPLLHPQNIDVVRLHKFITDNFDMLYLKNGTTRLYLRKLVCLYDILKYGRKSR